MTQFVAGMPGPPAGDNERRQWSDEVAENGDAQKRRILRYLAFGLMVGGSVASVETLFSCLQGERTLLDLVGVVAIALAGAVIYVLNRRGRVRPAELLAGGLLVVMPAYYVLLEGPKSMSLLLFPAGIIFANFLLGGQSGRVVATIGILLYAGIGLAHDRQWIQPISTPPFSNDLVTVAAICYALTIVSGMFTQDMRRALRRSEVRERALRAADEDKGRLLADLQARDEAQQRLLKIIRDLGSPIIPLAPGIVALPLIGAVDDQRAQQVMAVLLQGVAEHRATVAIVDVTGVPVVDTVLADALLQAAQGVWLLGAEPVLTGIRAETAQTLVGLGLDLSGITTLATLQEGLEYALAAKKLDKRVEP